MSAPADDLAVFADQELAEVPPARVRQRVSKSNKKVYLM